MNMQIHGDICTRLPESFELLAWSDMTPIQGIAHFYDDYQQPPAFVHSHDHQLPDDPWKRVHIIGASFPFEVVLRPGLWIDARLSSVWSSTAFQGHPEWDHEIVIPFINDYGSFSFMLPTHWLSKTDRSRPFVFWLDAEEDGTFTAEFAEAGRTRSKREHSGKFMGRALLRVLGVA